MDPNFDTTRINRMLRLHGLGSLDEQGTVQQLARLVADHEHFRSLLARCVPGLRSSMYEAMKPHLAFRAKPLDVYVSESGQLAERRQLPVLDEAGRMHPFMPPAIAGSDHAVAQAAVDREFSKPAVHLVCRKCAREATFRGDRLVDAIEVARLEGWTYDELVQNGLELCPECVPQGSAGQVN